MAEIVENPEDKRPLFHPWLRYGARKIDFFLFLPLGASIAIPFLMWAPTAKLISSHDWLFYPLIFVPWIFLEALLLSTWGTTPGKALLLIDVRRADGRKLGYGTALIRSIDVFGRGVGLCIPLLSPVMSSFSYYRLKAGHRPVWDQESDLIVQHGRVRLGRCAIAWLILGAAAASLTVLSRWIES